MQGGAEDAGGLTPTGDDGEVLWKSHPKTNVILQFGEVLGVGLIDKSKGGNRVLSTDWQRSERFWNFHILCANPPQVNGVGDPFNRVRNASAFCVDVQIWYIHQAALRRLTERNAQNGTQSNLEQNRLHHCPRRCTVYCLREIVGETCG